MRSRFNLRTTFLLRLHATGCKQESKRAGKQANKQASRQASKTASRPASKQASGPACIQASQPGSQQASKHKSKPCEFASKEHPASNSRTQMDRCRTPDADIVGANGAATPRPKPPLSFSHAAGCRSRARGKLGAGLTKCAESESPNRWGGGLG